MPRPEALALALALAAAPAAAWEEPARGSALRADLPGALRPHPEEALGAPIGIVVLMLRVEGDRAWFSFYAQRPGGVPIDMARTPMAARADHDPQVSDGTTMQALIRRSGRMWVAVQHGIGSTDSWWNDPQSCGAWRAVPGDLCS